MIKSCLLVGGDKRQRILSQLLTERGIAVRCAGMEGCVTLPDGVLPVSDIPAADLTLFPVPVTRDGTTVYASYASAPLPLSDVLRQLSPETVVAGGMIPPDMAQKLNERGIRHFDYAKSETFQRMNAVPSAEGAIEVALHNTPFTLAGARVCVVGYGRIGKALTEKLLGLHCRVTATARKPADLAAIEQAGAHAAETALLDRQGRFDVLFNTVPAPVITAGVLAAQSRDTLVIDLASKPGGVDFSAAEQQSIHCIHALSLPARCAPLTAAEIIRTAVFELLAEMD